MGPIDYTVGRDSSGNWNTSDVKAFMRCAGFIGSGGYAFILLCPFVQAHEQNWIRINGVDVIYAALPIYLYLNPSILGYLLRPLLEYQESSMYTNPYAAIDLGKRLDHSQIH